MASGVVDVCLIPEVSFDLYGEHGVLEYVHGLLRRKGHCVICVAEGAGQVFTSSLCIPHRIPLQANTCSHEPSCLSFISSDSSIIIQ